MISFFNENSQLVPELKFFRVRDTRKKLQRKQQNVTWNVLCLPGRLVTFNLI